MDDQKNLILAVVIATAILLLYYAFVLGPAEERQREALEAQQAEQAAAEQIGEDALLPAIPGSEQTGAPDVPSRPEALAQSERLRIETPELSGSIALTGARIDDLALTQYTQDVDPDSGVVQLFSPAGTEGAYYARLGWRSIDGENGLPGAEAEWEIVSGEVLRPETPVTIAYTSPSGIAFERTIEVDEHFMFTFTDRVTNQSGAETEISPYGLVRRDGAPEAQNRTWLVHEGVIGVLDGRRRARSYKNTEKDGAIDYDNVNGWLGIVDKYWLAALAPSPNATFDAAFRADPRADRTVFQTSWQMDPIAIADGETIEVSSNLFAGAKRAELLREYDETLGITRLDDSIDWGFFFFLTKPFFLMLEYFASLAGNFGVAILMLTVVVKAATFPLANASYKSMARMKKLQPKVTELRERFKADPQRQQQEMMQLYQREKVNPLMGCLPMLVQMPILFALYQTLFVTIEMRHAPFFGWIDDLSAKDPTNIWNLFGLLPYDPASVPVIGGIIGASFLALGIWPLLYGISMSATMTLNPPPPDPMQQKIFAFMPWVFMFVLSQWAAGLLIYWTWSNILTFTQQYIIIRRNGVDTPIGTFISKRFVQLKARLASGGAGSGGGGSGGAE